MSFVHLDLPIQFILWAVLEFWGLGPPNFLYPPYILGSFQGGLSDNSTHYVSPFHYPHVVTLPILEQNPNF